MKIKMKDIVMKIKMKDIVTDAGTQMRAAICEDTVREYMEADNMPPVTIYRTPEPEGRCILTDGFHRYAAATRRNQKTIDATIFPGTLREAILAAVAANSHHGLRRKPEDKRRAVMTLLCDPEWSQWSNGEIAKRCHVSDEFVRKLRILTSNVGSENGDHRQDNEPAAVPEKRTYTTKHGTVAEMETGNIGKGKRKSVATPEPEAPPEPKKISGGTTFDPAEYEDESEPPIVAGNVEQLEALERGCDIKQRFAALRREFQALHRSLKTFCETEEGEALLKHEQSFQTHINAITGYIESEEPYCVCYICQGYGCDSCENRGTMTKRRHDSRIPADQSAVIYVRGRHATHHQ